MNERRAFSVAVYARRNAGTPQAEILVIHHKRLRTWLPVGGELEEGEIPLEAARRELLEESGLAGDFRALHGACEGVPPGYLGYEEHQAGSKGMHMNFVFVAEVEPGLDVQPNHEFSEFRWVSRVELDDLESPKNVREFGVLAFEARAA